MANPLNKQLPDYAATGLAWVLGYLLAVRLCTEAHWIVRCLGLVILIVIPWSALNALMAQTLDPTWMLLPIAVSALLPVEP